MIHSPYPRIPMPPAPRVRECRSCVYASGPMHGVHTDLGVMDEWLCRRHAPVLVVRKDEYSRACFPVMEGDEWCGDYEYSAEVRPTLLGGVPHQ